MEEAYEKLKLVLRQEHNLSIVLKMFKTCWLGFRPVQFFSYKITGPKIKVTKEKQDAIQAMNFLKNMKTVQLFKDFGSIRQRIFTQPLRICCYVTLYNAQEV